jgi:hypothetical protein
MEGGGVKTQWQRTTQVCSTIDLQPDLLTAIREHADLHELGPIEAQALVCWETVSRRTGRAGLIERLGHAGHKLLTQAVIVTPTRLVWAQRADDGEAGAHSQLLARLDVTDYEKSPQASLLPDHGLQVFGVVTMGGDVGTLFFGFGEGPDAERARLELRDAVRAAHGEGPPADQAAAPDTVSAEGSAGGSG